MQRSLLLLSLLALMTVSATAHAFEYRYNPRKSTIEVDLSAADELLTPPTATVSSTRTEKSAPAAKVSPPQKLPPPPRHTQLNKPFFTADIPEAPKPALTAQPQPVVTRETKPAQKPAPVLVPIRKPEPEAPAAILDITTPENDITLEPAPAAQPETPTAAVPSLSDLSFEFEPTSSDLSPAAQKKLADLGALMKEAPEMRAQIRAYAKGDGDNSNARRMSLSRGLIVRSFLMEKGVKPTRLDVRALGADTDHAPIDRVDLVFVR